MKIPKLSPLLFALGVALLVGCQAPSAPGQQAAAEVVAPVESAGAPGFVYGPEVVADPHGAEASDAVAAGEHALPPGFGLGGPRASLLPNGAACMLSNACSSNFCVDGFCCESACDGQCAACNIQGSEGKCLARAGAPLGQRTACHTDGSPCGGACDGKNPAACAYPDGKTPCGQPSCAAGVGTLAALCDGNGTCQPPVKVNCEPYVCAKTACFSDVSGCQTDAECAADAYCTPDERCAVALDVGMACDKDSGCKSGFCADGFCCGTRCGEQCSSCGVAGSEGTCKPIKGVPHGTRDACAGTGACLGVCDGANMAACAYPGAATMCAEALCEFNVATVAAQCDGKGGCGTPMGADCPWGCEGRVCAGPPDLGGQPGDDGGSGGGTPPAGGCSVGGRGASRGDGRPVFALLALAAIFVRRRR